MDLLPSSCICLMIVVHNKMIMTERRLLPTSNLGRSLCAPLGGSRSFTLLLSWVAWGDVWRRSPLLCWGLWHWSWLHWCIPITGGCSLSFLKLLLCLLRITVEEQVHNHIP